MELFTQEIKHMKELQEILKEKQEIPADYKVAVIVYAFDNENKII